MSSKIIGKISTAEYAENNKNSSMLENAVNLFWRVTSVKLCS